MKYAKAIAAAVGSVCTVLLPLLADDVLNATEAGQLVTALISAIGTVWAVYGVENKRTDEPTP